MGRIIAKHIPSILSGFLLFLLVQGAYAQKIEVESFKLLPTDLTPISREGKRTDQNGQIAALIRIVTPETGFVFEGGALGIVDTQQRTGEIWVWVPKGLRKISIMHQQLGVLRDYRFPIEIEAARAYEMVLTHYSGPGPLPPVKQQFLAFKITPANAFLEVNNKPWTVEADGTAIQYVDFGTYSYRVRAANYFTEAGSVTVDNPDSTKVVEVMLKPDVAEVTLTVDADAEIWVNGVKKGVRTWTGPLGSGTYKIECKQAGHESSLVSKEIKSSMSGQTITLPAPKPVYGSLLVESTPSFCKLFIDGKDYGETPKSVNQILVGQHKIKLSKEGYADHVETVTITKDEQKQMKPTLRAQEKKEEKTKSPSEITRIRSNRHSYSSYNNSFFMGGRLSARITTDEKNFWASPEIGYKMGYQWVVAVGIGYQYHYYNYLGFIATTHYLVFSPYVRYIGGTIGKKYSLCFDLMGDFNTAGEYRIGFRPVIAWQAAEQWTVAFSMGFLGYDKMYGDGFRLDFKSAAPSFAFYYCF